MKRLLILPLFASALALSACGLRGDLQRPDPLWGEPAPEEADAPEETSALRGRSDYADNSYRDPETGEVVWVQNENGGDKPLAAPVKPLDDEGGLPPLTE